jgi:hypothetical protein
MSEDQTEDQTDIEEYRDVDREAADEYSRLVLKRIGCESEDLECPRERSEMTPCLARDGGCVIVWRFRKPICVGCEADLHELIEKEKALQARA